MADMIFSPHNILFLLLKFDTFNDSEANKPQLSCVLFGSEVSMPRSKGAFNRLFGPGACDGDISVFNTR